MRIVRIKATVCTKPAMVTQRKIYHGLSLYKDASVTKNLTSKMLIFFLCCFELSGPKESRWDTFELTQTLQRVLGSHFRFGGKYKFFRLLHKAQQYGCLWTPMDLSNQDLTFLS